MKVHESDIILLSSVVLEISAIWGNLYGQFFFYVAKRYNGRLWETYLWSDVYLAAFCVLYVSDFTRVLVCLYLTGAPFDVFLSGSGIGIRFAICADMKI